LKQIVDPGLIKGLSKIVEADISASPDNLLQGGKAVTISGRRISWERSNHGNSGPMAKRDRFLFGVAPI